MSEPLEVDGELQGRSGALVTSVAGFLWATAPPWRNLVIASCVITSLAIAAPIVLPHAGTAPAGLPTAQSVNAPSQAQLSTQACALQAANAPIHVLGHVAGVVSQAEVQAATQRVEAQIGGTVNPKYLPMAHVFVMGDAPNEAVRTIAAVPPDLNVKIGARVELNSRYRDPTRPCGFIPWTVNRAIP